MSPRRSSPPPPPSSTTSQTLVSSPQSSPEQESSSTSHITSDHHEEEAEEEEDEDKRDEDGEKVVEIEEPKLSCAPILRTSRRTTSLDSRNSDNNSNNIPNLPTTPVKTRRSSGCGKSPAKSPNATGSDDGGRDSSSQVPTTPPTPETPKSGSGSKEQHKMTREERKIAAYMKAFERMEKAALRKQEMEKKKVEEKGKDKRDTKGGNDAMDDEDGDKTSSADECGIRNINNVERLRKKG